MEPQYDAEPHVELGPGARVVALVAGALAGLLLAAEPQPCRSLDLPTLLQAMRQAEQDELLFFATWCGACKKHLQSRQPKTTVVAAFDDAAAVRALLSHLRLPIPCLIDGGAADALGVRSVPARFRLVDGHLRRL